MQDRMKDRMKDRVVSLFKDYDAFIKADKLKVNNMSDKEISVDGTIYNSNARKFDLGEGQKIIDKELASPKGSDDFGGSDYPCPSNEELEKFAGLGAFGGKDCLLPSSEKGVDFDPNHDVDQVLSNHKLSNTAYDYQPEDSTHPYSFGKDNFSGKEFPPIVSVEEADVIKKFYNDNPRLKGNSNTDEGYTFNPEDPWIQTYSGKRFTPTNPNPDAIVIEDIAHALSMQCRFGGHVKDFYSVAQHCVLVSYICNFEDAFWGLMHDASETYLIDLPRPLKHSGKLDAYIEFEGKVQAAICKRFDLPEKEPASIKKADTILLVTEARDLLPNKRSDWTLTTEPLPFEIKPLGPREAKDLFMKRFYELTNMPGAYEHYLHYENQK